MRIHIPLLASLIVALAPTLGASADNNILFSYDLTQGNVSGIGAGKADVYDVCIRLNNTAFRGAKVQSISVPLVKEGGKIAPEASAWCVTELPADGAPLQPIATAEATIADDVLTATFASPVTLGDEPMYIGYTLTVTEIEESNFKYPVSKVPGTTAGSLYYRARETKPAWLDVAHSQTNSGMSPMVVTIGGELPPAYGELTIYEPPYGLLGKEAITYANVRNLGSEPISDITIDFVASPGAEPKPIEVHFDTPITNLYGDNRDFSFYVPNHDQAGEYVIYLNLSKVNGQDNAISTDIETALRTVRFIPTNRPLAEEYTGLWCAACPSGYVAMEQGKYYHGDDFVGIAFHFNDYMQKTAPFFPSKITGYPSLFINRTKVSPTAAVQAWEREAIRLAPVEIELDVRWASEEKEELVVISRSQFIKEYRGANLKLTYALVSDNLSDPSWAQHNDYWERDAADYGNGPYWDLFCGKDRMLYGLTFNDVLCVFDNPRGIDGSLPEYITPYTTYTHVGSINLNDAIAEKNRKLIWKDRKDLRVIGMVVDADSGLVLNSISSPYVLNLPIHSSVGSVADDNSPVVQSTYYDLQGRTLGVRPTGTPYILVELHADGHTTTSKHLDAK